MLSFDEFCVHAGIIGDAKIRFEIWLGAHEVRQQYTEAMWRVKWERFKRITGDTPRRARVGD